MNFNSEQIKIFLWLIFVIEVFTICLGIIFGGLCGYKNSLIAHGILGLFIGISLLILLFVYLLIDLLIRVIIKVTKK